MRSSSDCEGNGSNSTSRHHTSDIQQWTAFEADGVLWEMLDMGARDFELRLELQTTCRFRSMPEGREGQGSLVEEEESAARQREDQQLLQSLKKAQSHTKRDYHTRV